jgi:hypothetical protein
MGELLSGSWATLFVHARQYPLQTLAAVLVAAQFGIFVLHMIFGDKNSSRGCDGGDIGGWDFGDADGGGD